jgi:hypothetical protein
MLSIKIMETKQENYGKQVAQTALY